MNIKEMEKMSVDNLEFVKTSYLKHKSFIPMIIVRAMKNDKKINIVSVLGDEKLVEKRYEAMACLGIELGVRTLKIIKKSWKGDEVKVSFEEVDTKDPTEFKASLLEEFWKTFNLIKSFKEDIISKDEEARKHIETTSADKLTKEFGFVFNKFIKQLK